MNKLLPFIIILITIISISCGNKKNGQDDPKPPGDKPTTIIVPKFNRDSAFAFVEKQVAFGPRVPGTDAHEKCATWLKSKLNEYCQEIFVQDVMAKAFNGKTLTGYNLIGSFNPNAKRRILLCSHWDSRPFADHDPDPANFQVAIDGANDGASGVGVLLEIARLMKKDNPPIGIDIIFFDLEDYGEPQGTQTEGENWALGSQFWGKSNHYPGYNAEFGILLDMVGAPDAKFYMEGTSMYFAESIVNVVWNKAHKLGYQNYFIQKESNPITDDHLYINQLTGIPTIDIIHYDPTTTSGFFKYWHTIEDNIQNIDRSTLNVVGHTLLEVVYNQ